MDPSVPLVTPNLVPPIKVQIQGRAMEIGMMTSAFDDVVKEFDTLQIEFSKLSLGEVYELQQEAVTEIRMRENVVAYQATKHPRKAKQCKAILKEKEK